MVNRVLLHGEELEGCIVADGPNCTCRSGDVCPMCGTAQADYGCAVHDGHELAALLKREATEEEVSAAIGKMTVGEVLEKLDPTDALDALLADDKDAVLDWLEAQLNKPAPEKDSKVQHITAGDVLAKFTASELLNYLEENAAGVLEDWVHEHVTAAMTTDDNGKKVPTLNITEL